VRLKSPLGFLKQKKTNLSILRFLIPIPNQGRKHTKYYCEVDIAENFQKARQHILNANPRRTNHDMLQLMLFAKVLAGVQKRASG